MKTRSKENEFGKTCECSKGKLRRLLTGVMLAAGAILFLCLVIGAAVAGGTDSCQLTSQVALRSCQARAPSDYFLAIGKCDNVADPVARKACQQQALADLNDAKQTCKDQFDARQTVCDRLGGAPYDPVIDPTDQLRHHDRQSLLPSDAGDDPYLCGPDRRRRLEERGCRDP